MQKQARVYDRSDRKNKPFGAVWSVAGKRKFQFFESAAKRDRFLSEFNAAIKKTGPALLDLSAADAVIMVECVRKLGSAAEVMRAVDDYARRTQVVPIQLAEAIKLFIDEKTNAGRDDEYVRKLQGIVGKFPSTATASQVSASDARTWTAGLAMAPVSVSGHIKAMRTLWRWLIARGYARENIFDAVPLPNIEESEPEFLSVDSVAALFKVAQQRFPDSVAYFALGAFAGLRSSAAVRLDGMQHIRFEQKGILITGENAKNKRRQFIDGHEANLWAWLEWCKTYAPEGFDLNARMWERRRGQVAEAAGMSMPHNALRHSFCTYHVALHGNAGKTATLLTHRGNVAILYQHYKGNATKSEAENYFSIRPSR